MDMTSCKKQQEINECHNAGIKIAPASKKNVSSQKREWKIETKIFSVVNKTLVVLGRNCRRNLFYFHFISNVNHVCKDLPIPYLVFGSETLGNSPQTPNPPLSSSAFTNFAMSGWKRCSTSAAITRQNK